MSLKKEETTHITHPLNTSEQQIIQDKPEQNMFNEEKYSTELP